MRRTLLVVLAIVIAGFACAATSQTLSNYQSTVTGEMPNYYFTFDNGSLTSITNSVTLQSSPVSFDQFAYDVFGNPGDSVYFTGQSDGLVGTGDGLISGGGTSNLTSTASGAITFLFKSLDPGLNTGQRIIFSCGGSTTNHNSLQLFIENTNPANGDPNSLKFRFGDGTTTILPAAKLIPDAWYYFAFTYTEASTTTNKATWYLGRPGGTLASGLTTNAPDCVAGDGTDFYIGNNPALNAGFRNPGNGQVDEFAIWNRQLSSSEVQAQFARLPNRTPAPASTYEGIVNNQSPNYFFKLDDTYVDSVSGTVTMGTNSSGNSFNYDWFGNPIGSCVFSNGADALTNVNLLAGGGVYSSTTPGTGKGSISCLFHSLSVTNFSGERFIYSAGGSTTTTNGFGLFFENLTSTSNPGSLKVRFGNTSSTILPWTNIVTGQWYFFAMNYDESLPAQQVNWWLGQPGGALQSGVVNAVSNSLAGMGTVFLMGNNTNFSSGFRNGSGVDGQLSEFAIWHRTLSGTEVTNQFNGLVSVPVVAAPELSIALSGVNVILAWPSSTDPTYNLQSTASLSSPSWGSAGSASIVGSQFVVTNALTSNPLFYRLAK